MAGKPKGRLAPKLRERNLGVPIPVDDLSEDDRIMYAEEYEQADPTDDPVQKSRRSEAKPSKTKGKNVEEAAKNDDANKETQQDLRDQELPSRFSVPVAMLIEKVNPKPKKSNKPHVIIARRKKGSKTNVELLLWDGEMEWIRATEVSKQYKTAHDRYKRIEKAAWEDFETPDWHEVKFLDNVMLIKATDTGQTPSPAVKKGVMVRSSDNDRDSSMKMLQYVLQKVAQNNSWLVASETGSYQYATGEDETMAQMWKDKSTQGFVKTLLQRRIKGGKPYEKARRMLSSVKVVWRYPLDKNRIVKEDDESPLPSPTAMTPTIKMIGIWTVFFELFHNSQSHIDNGKSLPTRASGILPRTKAQRKELGHRMIIDSPHIVWPNSWPYLIALALLSKKDAGEAEVEAGLEPSETRFRDAVHTCMTQYQEEHQMVYPEVVHVFWLLQRYLQEEEGAHEREDDEADNLPGAQPRIGFGDDKDSEEDESKGTPGSDGGASGNEENATALTSSKRGELANEDVQDSLAEEPETRLEREEYGGDADEPGNIPT